MSGDPVWITHELSANLPTIQIKFVTQGMKTIFISLFSLTVMAGAHPNSTNKISEPLTIIGKSNVVIGGLRITSTNNCGIIIKNSKNVRIENCWIGPCAGEAIVIEGCVGVTITSNRIERVRSGVYALDSQKIVVTHNRCRDVQGPMPRGQFVQFDKVSGAGNVISFNLAQNRFGQSHPEDVISLFKSSGTSNSPIAVIGNKIRGGGPSASGGGIMTGDGGGAWILVKDNVLVDPGQYGISISGGEHIQVIGNKIFGKQQPFTNVGLFVWKQSEAPCGNHVVKNNQVRWLNREGKENPCWNANNCGEIVGWDENNWHAELNDKLLPENLEIIQSR